MKKSAVVIGRFQPFHNGHQELIENALATADQVLIVLGSACGPRSLRNPFTADEREEMIKLNLKDSSRIQFLRVRDYFYNDSAWTNEVREKVNQFTGGQEVFLCGHRKDETSSYLTWFPEWKCHEISSCEDIHATSIRQEFLRDFNSLETQNGFSAATKNYLKDFVKTEFYPILQTEQIGIDAYKASWSKAPFPPTFVTADAMVLCAGHILLIQRKKVPGKGLWALPGGFLDPDERIFDCALRELNEETQIEVPRQELKAAFKKVQIFDHPLRSSRGRTITHVHLYELKRDSLPKITASDDAMAARWLPELDVARMEDQLFEDHFHMIHRMVQR